MVRLRKRCSRVAALGLSGNEVFGRFSVAEYDGDGDGEGEGGPAGAKPRREVEKDLLRRGWAAESDASLSSRESGRTIPQHSQSKKTKS